MKPASILIIDKLGIIAEPLALKLRKEFPVIFVSVPFRRKFPMIPDNKYSHIIVIGSDGSDLEFLPKLIKKAKSINSNLILALSLFSKEKLFRKVWKAYQGAEMVLYGDIFDNKPISRNKNLESIINKFIYQAQKFGRIDVAGNGLGNTYPVFISDVVDGIIDIIFGLHKPHSLFYLFPKHGPSELALAHMIQKNNPEITIDFVSHSVNAAVSYPGNGKYLLGDKYALSKKIRKINIGESGLSEDEPKRERLKKIKHFPFFIVWILVFLIFSPLIFTLFFSFLGLNTLYFAKAEVEKGNLTNVKRTLHLSNAFFYLGKEASNILAFQGRFVGVEFNLGRLMGDIDSGHKISLGLLQTFDAASYFAKVFEGISSDPPGDFAKGENNLKNAIVSFQRLKAEGKIPSFGSSEIESLDSVIKLLSNTTDIMSDIFGPNEQRVYLVLFQNNMELRPGGGIIDQYGILKLNAGKITDFSIHDVYDADRKLRGHAEPPFPIRRYLPLAHWYMRDSNFDVDFVKGASSISNFLFAETGEKASGVIAIDLSFVKNILNAIGPVYVDSYKETVGENNLFELGKKHKEKDFLQSLYRAMQTKISSGDIPYVAFIRAISDSLIQKHLMFAFNDSFQNVFTVNGWSSALWDKRKEDIASVNDFLGINEANLGANKVNYYVFRNISQKVIIGDKGNISEELDISYKNSSISLSEDDYKNYLRIILPKDTKISSISINNISQSIVDAITDPKIYEGKNFIPPIGLEVEKTVEENKTIYGFIFNVPAGDILNIKIKYNLAKKINLNLSSFSYTLKLFKQPGVDFLPYSLSLIYPNNFNVIKASEGIDRRNDRISYSEKVVQDEDLVIDFVKK